MTSARGRLGPVATVIDAGRPGRLRRVGEDLHDRGVRRLMVEGGGTMHTQFLTGGLADELQLVVAPFFVGDSRAPAVRRRRTVPLAPRTTARTWSRAARSATSCSCATRSPTGSRADD